MLYLLLSWTSYLFFNHQHPSNSRNVNLVTILYVRYQSVLSLKSVWVFYLLVCTTYLCSRLRIDHDTRITDQTKVANDQPFSCCLLNDSMKNQHDDVEIPHPPEYQYKPRSVPLYPPRWCMPDHRRSHRRCTERERTRGRYSIYLWRWDVLSRSPELPVGSCACLAHLLEINCPV